MSAAWVFFVTCLATDFVNGEPTIVETTILVEQIANVNFASQILKTFDVLLTSEQWIRGINATSVRHEVMKAGDSFEPLSQIFSKQSEQDNVLHPAHLAFVGTTVVGRKSSQHLRCDIKEPKVVCKNSDCRHKMRVSCNLDDAFPFDAHACSICFLATKWSTAELQLRWSGYNAIKTLPKLKIPSFYLHKLTQITTTHQVSLPSQYASLSLQRSHSSLCIEFEFRRLLSVSVIRFFLPSSLIYLLGTLSSFVSRCHITARLLLVAVSALAQTVTLTGYFFAFPSSSSMTAVDVWCILIFVQYCVLVILEMAVIVSDQSAVKYRNLMKEPLLIREKSRSRYERMASRQLMHRECSRKNDGMAASESVFALRYRKLLDQSSLLAARLQLFSRFLLPLIHLFLTCLFFAFNLIEFPV